MGHRVVIGDSALELARTTRGDKAFHVLWNEWGSEGCLSLPELVEEHAEQIKAEYLVWAAQVPLTHVRGASLYDRLKITPVFSFWWMTLVSEKSALKSPEMVDIFKLRALEIEAEKRGWTQIAYHGRNRAVTRSLRQWCERTGRRFQWGLSLPGKVSAIATPLFQWRQALPHPIQGLLYLLRYLVLNFRFFKKEPLQRAALNVVTYFPNADLKKLASGIYESHYWGPLHEVLDEIPGPIHWIWFCPPISGLSAKQILAFQKTAAAASPQDRFTILQGRLTAKGLWDVVRRASKLAWMSFRLGDLSDAFRLPKSQLSFFPVLKSAWESSLRGHAGISGLLYMSLFERLAAENRGPLLYLWENQPWEAAMIREWRKHAPELITGYQHSALPPLLLRSFDYQGPGVSSFRPQPDQLLVNGPESARLLTESGCALELTQVEAVRYGWLETFRKQESPEKTLLVATGFSRRDSRRQVEHALEAIAKVKEPWRLLVKAHPYLPLSDFFPEAAGIEVVTGALGEVLPNATVLYSANMSAVAIEGLSAGIPTAVYVSAESLNLSPALGYPDAVMIHTSEELRQVLDRPVSAELKGYFLHGKALPRWREALLNA